MSFRFLAPTQLLNLDIICSSQVFSLYRASRSLIFPRMNLTYRLIFTYLSIQAIVLRKDSKVAVLESYAHHRGEILSGI